MSATERDYYELLGVARDADEREIKKAFRALARQLHPDVSSDPEADVRFREVSEAYEVLSNAETRQLYDRYGHAGLRSGGFTPDALRRRQPRRPLLRLLRRRSLRRPRRRRPREAPTLPAEIEIDLVDAARGTTVGVKLEVAVTCGTCHGDGVKPGTSVSVCPRCGGNGRLQQVSRSIFGEFIRTTTCPECRGDGRKIEHPCETCAGAGRTLEERTLDVEVPAGIHDGQRIRLSGEGHAGALGGRAGDLYVAVRVRPDDRFVREGNDMFSQVDLTIVQAALGAIGRVSRPSTGRSSSSSSRERSRARYASCGATGCRCSRASAAATTASSSTSPSRAG